MNCLSCGTAMSNITLLTPGDLISYDLCESCGSFWLDRGELDKMARRVDVSVEMTAREKAARVTEGARKCLRCPDAVLEKVGFPGGYDVVLDRCPSCGGFFLDGGELDMVNRTIERTTPVKGGGFGVFVNAKHLPYFIKRIVTKEAPPRDEPPPPIKGATVKAKTDRSCPACEAKLTKTDLYGVEVDTCGACGGLWLDQGELKKLEEKAQASSWRETVWPDNAEQMMRGITAMMSRRECPVCDGRKMFATAFGDSGVMMDWCPSCRGVWLDRDEFYEITRYIRNEIEKAGDDEKKRTALAEMQGIQPGEEGALADMMDADATLSSLMSVRIFENPAVMEMMRHPL
jgi:Zn-finger nucleic acid-binding protein